MVFPTTAHALRCVTQVYKESNRSDSVSYEKIINDVLAPEDDKIHSYWLAFNHKRKNERTKETKVQLVDPEVISDILWNKYDPVKDAE